METTDTIIIGAGQAGLAMSRCLTDRGVDHVVLDRGRLAERWRSERWDSLRLLTPNWMTRLPGWTYRGPEPDGFMTAGELVASFEAYARSFAAPVRTAAAVTAVRRRPGGYDVETTVGSFAAVNVVVATGWCDRPAIPPLARHLPPATRQLVPGRYRRPSDVAAGGVLVVGASASGVQLADELARAGRDVTLAVGRHTRLPRTYRGMDVFWWLEQTGRLDRTIDEQRDAARARREPSLQLVGRSDRRAVDLAALQRAGVHLAGRLVESDGHRATFAGDLAATVEAAERRMRRLLIAIDGHIDRAGLAREVLAPATLPVPDTAAAVDHLDLRRVGTVIWATGYRRSYPWLQVPVLDADGEIRHRRGVTPAPGLYVLGQRHQHTRRSTFVDGVGADAAFVADHLVCRPCQPAHHA